MLRLSDIPSARAEAALYVVNHILNDFRIRTAQTADDSPELLNHAREALLRLVTVAEVFVGEHLVDLAELRLPDDEIVLRIWEERMPRTLRDWPGRRAAWKDVFEIKWDYPHWDELDGFIKARNLVAHGMGTVGRSDIRGGIVKKGVIDKLNAAKLTLRGLELIAGEADVERCGARVSDFILWLDELSRPVLVEFAAPS